MAPPEGKPRGERSERRRKRRGGGKGAAGASARSRSSDRKSPEIAATVPPRLKHICYGCRARAGARGGT
eukprot:4235618-Alexandrium_andersonii.AAC.1